MFKKEVQNRIDRKEFYLKNKEMVQLRRSNIFAMKSVPITKPGETNVYEFSLPIFTPYNMNRSVNCICRVDGKSSWI